MPISIGLAIALLVTAPAVSAMDAQSPPAVDPTTTHTVAADGSADFTSVQDAVDTAAVGDVVAVRPGTYTESVTIDKDLSLVGDGPRGDIVIAATPGDSPGLRDDVERPYAILVTGGMATVSDLTVATPGGTNGVVATGGSPLIQRVSLVGPEETEVRSSAYVHRPFTSLGFFGQTDPTVRDSEWDGYVAVRDGASATFVGNTVVGDTISIDGPGESSVRDSILERGSISFSQKATGIIEGNEFRGDISQVGVDSGSTVEVRGNTFSGSIENAAIWMADPDTAAVMAGNTITDSVNGLRIAGGGTATVEGNTLDVAGIGIAIDGTDALIQGNVIESEGAGITIFFGADPIVTGNTIDAVQRAIAVGRVSNPTITGNLVCGDEVSLYVTEGATPDIGDNELCGEASAR